MRRAMFTTAAMNIAVCGALLPPAAALCAAAGLPADSHPFYLATVSQLSFFASWRLCAKLFSFWG
jgi:hypothetical protein